MVSRSQLKFHETFQPESGYITRIMELAHDSFSGDKYEISEQTGIPTGKQKGKVEPHIKYAYYMGLVNYSFNNGTYDLKLTELGKVIFDEDKYIHETLTKWLCHYKISCESGAPQWFYLVHKANSGFVVSNSSQYLLDKAADFFATKISFEELFGVVKRSYLEGFFSEINYINWDESIEFIEHFMHQEFKYVYAYVLLDLWEQLFKDKEEITISELSNVLGFSKVFNFSSETTDEVLDSIAGERIISINRQLNPVTIIKLCSSTDLLNMIYSCLL